MTNHSKSNKNGVISFLKFLFCIIIVMMHYGVPSNFSKYMFEGGYIYVDFFFVLQGFYLIKDWTLEEGRNAYNDAMYYFINRLKRFFSCVFFSAVFMLIFELCIAFGDVTVFLKDIFAFLWQILFVSQFFDFMSLEVGGILWFLSASIIIGTLMTFLCKQFGKKILIILPFVISIIINYIYINIGNLDVWGIVFSGLFLRASLIRALLDISIGIMADSIYEFILKYRFRRWFYYFEIFFSTLIIVISMYIVLYMPHAKMDFYLVLCFGLLLIMLSHVFNGKNCKFTNILDKVCMPMYIFQVCSILVTNTFVTPSVRNWAGLICVLIIDIVMSIIWIVFASKINLKNILIEKVQEE